VKWLARFSIRNTVLVHMLIAALIIIGSYSLAKLPRELMSEISFNWVFLRVDLPGAAPQEIEQLITDPIEEVIEEVEGIASTYSRSKEGYSFLSIKFEQTDPQTFRNHYQDLKDKFGSIDLPEETEDPFWLNFTSQDFMPMVQVVIHGDLDRRALYLVTRDLERDVKAIDGIGKVEVGGIQERQLWVEVNPDALGGYGLTLTQVAAALKGANLNLPGGNLKTSGEEYILRTVGQFESPDQIGEVIVGTSPGGGLVRVSDIAQVQDTFRELRILSRFEGQPAATLSISKKAGGNSIKLIEEIRALAEVYGKRLDGQAEVSISGDTSVQIDNMLTDLQNNALLGMILVVIVLWLVLGLRNALITAMGIPLAFLATFIFMWATGATLNGNSLFGLVLVIGIIVDDAIVLVENCARHRSLGKDRAQAVIDGISEVAVPVLAAILTTVAAFLPLMLMPGIMGRFMRVIPMVVCMALIASLVEALISLPCHVHEWGEHDPKRLEARSRSFARFVDPYLRGLKWLVAAPIPWLAELEGRQRLAWRLAGWALSVVPIAIIVAAACGGVVWQAATGGEGAAPLPSGALPTGVVPAALAGGGAFVLAIVLANWRSGRDLPGDYGMQFANLLGITATGAFFFLSMPTMMFGLFGQTGAILGFAVPAAAILVAGVIAALRRRLLPLVRSTWHRCRHVRYSVLSAVYLGMIPLAAGIGASVGLDLFGADEHPQFAVRVRMPEGTALRDTDRVLRELERATRAAVPAQELESITSYSGLLMTDREWFIKSSVGGLIVNVVGAGDRDRSVEEIVSSLRAGLSIIPGPDSIEIKAAKAGPPTGGDISLKVQGRSLEQLVELSEIIKAEMAKIDGVTDIRDDWVLGKKELRVRVDDDRAALLGVSEREVGIALRAAFDGIEATRFQDADEDVPVLVRYAQQQRSDLRWITRTLVPTLSGALVPFGDVASLESDRSVDAIRHFDGERSITIEASVDRTVTTPIDATRKVRDRLADFDVRFPGYRLNFTGEFEEFQESMRSLLYLGILGLLLVYLILGAQFRSFLQPAIIIGFTFPGALLGASLALLISGTPLSILTMYGVVALLGIVVNDSLVYISFMNYARDNGAGVEEAILEAARVRLRPIVLTTVTTVFGLLPMALGIGGKSVAWGPLATTIVAGLLFATATTLLVIPPVYRCFADIGAQGTRTKSPESS
jgi:multidrug efflux pump subunit AcrB